MKRHFVDLSDFSAETLLEILDKSHERKQKRAGLSKGVIDADAPLHGKSLALIFAHPSTRTRVSFELAMHQLGGHVLALSQSEMQLGRGETVSDTARVLSRYVDGVMVRTPHHQDIEILAKEGDLSVINGLTSFSHPCQVMADVMTLQEKWQSRSLSGKIVTWLGDGNNVCHSWMHMATFLGIELRIACPKEFSPSEKVLQWAQQRGGKVSVVRSAAEAVQGAHCIMTDTWTSMGQQEAADRCFALGPYQVNSALMAKAHPEAVFLHCLPAHRGEEVTDDVIDGPQSVVFDVAENRLHVQKGILAWCLG